MDSTEDDIRRQIQVRSSLALILERQRLEAVLAPVREQFEDELKALTEAEQDSKELKSAKRSLLFDRIEEEVQLPFPAGAPASDEDTPVAKDSVTRQYDQEGRRVDLQGARPPQDRGRQAPPGRP